MSALGPVPRRFESLSRALADLAAVAAAVGPLVRAYRGGLDGALRERVMVAVSEVNACAGCTHVHRRWALREGVGEQELDAIAAGDLSGLDVRSRAAVMYASELAERRFLTPLPAEVMHAASQLLSARELEQVTAIARAIALANLSFTALADRRRRHAEPSTAHPLFARVWARVAGWVAPDRRRAELLAGLNGRVLEIGCGDGRNFDHYPPEVDRVVAVEPEPYLRHLAERTARTAAGQITVVDAGADALPAETASCDAVVCSLVLCSVADQATALAEITRVLRPGGELRFLEHVVAHRPAAAAVQRALDRTVWPHVSGGCHLARDTVTAIRASGLVIEHARTLPAGRVRKSVPLVLGTARNTAI